MAALTVPGAHSAVGEAGISAAQAMRQVFAALPDLILVLDTRLQVLFASRALRSYSVEELAGLHISQLLPGTVEATALAAMGRVLNSGEVDGYVAQIEETDGRTRHFAVRVSAIRHAGSVAGLTLHATETTEQVRAERAIATQARMIESMLEGVAVIDDKGRVDLTNPAFDAMFGYAPGGLVGRDIRALAGIPVESAEHPLSPGRDEPVVLEFEGRKRDGGRFVAAGVLSGLEIAGRNHSLLVLQDVSERKQLERGILHAVNREQYRIGNDLHDGLGQELTGIALMLRGLAGRLTAEYPPLLPEIEGITRLVSNAIESTRALARGLSPVNVERGGLQDALESLAMHATELYGVPVVFTHRLTGQRSLNAELANHLYRIAQEAVRNAVRHGQARSIRLHLSSVRAKVRLTITDDGSGMPVDAMNAAGMGLKIMCYRARILGGDVSFAPVEPRGTRVVCECPFEPGSAAHVRPLPKARARATP
ncbi:MAG TPA: PAS domain S-box protein [Povalibacter sp.]|nr:PAS domain S-box protein [Povalibacter sp.]